MRLNKEIESNHPDAFGDFLIDLQVLGFLEKLEPNTETLFGWIQLTRGTGHSGSWLGTNAANLINRISKDYFAGKDLSDTTLTNVSLWGADLRGTRLKKTRLINADLTSSRFFRRDIVFSKITHAFVSFYALKKNTTRKYIRLMHSLSREFMQERELFILTRSPFGHDLLWEMAASVKDIKDLESLSERLSTKLSTKVAVYFDELEELIQAQDSVKVITKPRAFPKASR